MKTFVWYLTAYLFRIALWFRYRIRAQGLEKLNPETLNKAGGILFLPNHPAVFVDPAAITLALFPNYQIRPMIVEYMYYLPGVNWLMRKMNALAVPNFSTSSNSLKRKKNEAVIQSVIEGLKNKENFLIYPAGKCKATSIEQIGGASAVPYIINEVPEANIVLVRIKGLWGSSFSKAFTNVTPPFFPTLMRGIKSVFKNLLFFSPRRQIIVEFEPAPANFPYNASRVEINRWLENWYNQPDGLSLQKGDLPGDSLIMISSSMWGESYPEMHKTVIESGNSDISLENIPQEVRQKVRSKLGELAEVDPKFIRDEMSLASDLGLDSIHTAEFVVFLQDTFDISNIPPNELTTVGKAMAIAAKQLILDQESEDEETDLSKWKKTPSNASVFIPEAKSIPEAFLKTCSRMGSTPACVDLRSGVLTYSQLKVRVLLLAEVIRNLPGENIGVLLPASVGATIMILATQLAGKVPVMINWTIGPKHLESVRELSKIETVLTSWGFLDRLDNVDLSPIENQLVMLEDMRGKFGIGAKLKAFFRSKMSYKSILKLFNADKINAHDKAVLLFTSGTESLPKGVPLTHENILRNLRSSITLVQLKSEDVIYGILPPFHAFGFSISTLLGILTGIRVAFSPDPTDGKKLIKGFERWGVTIMVGAPTFIKGMLKAAIPEQLKSMELCVTGAEKAPPELFHMIEQLGKKGCLIEGYGITECSPVLTGNRPGREAKGVGQPVPEVELLIIHPETFEPQPVNTQGLILVRGPNIFSGYLNPSISSPFINVNGQEWYKTGDLGFIDEENHLTISGRLKRFIKIGGEMVSLAAVEDAILKLALKKGWPLNEEGPSLAISAKEQENERPRIVLFSIFDISVDEINKSLREYGFSNIVKIANTIKLVEIPVMGSGKINYRALENQYLKGDK